MAEFTYNLSSTDPDELNIAKVRLELGDTSVSNGVKPDGGNFSDAELAIWLEEEDDHVFHTVIRACEALSRLWSNVVSITQGPRREEYSKISENWKERAKELRNEYGNPAGGGGTAFGVASARVDGYSEAAA